MSNHQKSDEELARELQRQYELDELEKSVMVRNNKSTNPPKPIRQQQNQFFQQYNFEQFEHFTQPHQFNRHRNSHNNFYANHDEFNIDHDDFNVNNEIFNISDEQHNNYFGKYNHTNNINKKDVLTGEKLTDFINSTFDQETPKQKIEEKKEEKIEEKKEANVATQLSPEIIKALTKFGKKVNNLNCPICADTIKIDEGYYICYGTSTNTEGHYFHTECLHQALTYKLTCPVCQKKL